MSERTIFTVDIDAKPARIWRALTEEDALRSWFAEHAEIDLAAGVLAFWGKGVYATASRGAQRITEVIPQQRLAFDWQVRDKETSCAFTLDARGGATTVTATQAGAAITDFWLISLMNLRAFVEDGAAMRRFEPSGAREQLEVSIDIDAAPADVFTLFTDPKHLERWFAKSADIDPVPGGRYDIGWKGTGPVKILDLVPDRKLSYSWRENQEKGDDSVVTWSLDGSGGRTRLTMVHSGFAPDQPIDDYDMGWTMFCMRIKDLAEHGPSRTVAIQRSGPGTDWEAAG